MAIHFVLFCVYGNQVRAVLQPPAKRLDVLGFRVLITVHSLQVMVPIAVNSPSIAGSFNPYLY